MRVDVSTRQEILARRRERIALTVAALAIGAVVGAALGAMRAGGNDTVAALARRAVDGPVADQLPQLLLDIHFRALQALRDTRTDWQKRGLRPSPLPNPQPAALRVGESQLEVTLAPLDPAQSRLPLPFGRLQVDVHGAGDFAGMRQFVLEDPDEPLLVRQLILAHELERSHALAPTVLAVGVRVNGDRQGTAVLVEQPSLAMVLRAQRPVGAVVGWSVTVADGNDAEVAYWERQPPPAHGSTGASALRGTPLEAHTAWAQARLDAMRAGQIPPEDVLDVQLTARLLALAELTGLGAHVVTWQRLWWYLNPTTNRLEPLVMLGPELSGPVVRADALLPLLLRSTAMRDALATHLRAEATRLMAPEAEQHVARYFLQIWPTLAQAIWSHDWLVVRQRAQRFHAAEALPVDLAPPATPAAAILAPAPPTAVVAP